MKRAVRVAERIRAEVMDLFLRGAVKDPRASGATVTHVQVTDDLQHARIFVRTLEEADERRQREVVKVLRGACGFLRRELGSRLKMKYTPEIRFEWDDGIDRAQRLEQLLDEIRTEGEGAE